MEATHVPHFIKKNGIDGESFAHMAEIALKQLKAFEGRAEIVCGPISTGGFGRVFTNLLVFNHAIEVLTDARRPIWSQVPFEKGLARLEGIWKRENPGAGYCQPILDDFYGVLFDRSPKLLGRAWFLNGEFGWKTSKGATWERQRLQKIGVDVRDFEEAWHMHCVLPKDLD